MREFKSFYKTVAGNEGNKCHYTTRLDTYGCGCQHDCSYCYAKSLLDFRGLWDADDPAVADIDKIRRKVKKLRGTVRLGGMTDCFQPLERTEGVTYETIKALNDANASYLIVTKSPLVAEDKYLDILDKKRAHIQVTVTTLDDELAKTYEQAAAPSRRVQAIEKLAAAGYDVQVRLSPYIPEYVDTDRLAGIECDKILVEFLRVNHWVRKWFPSVDMSAYTVKQSGYEHMPLERKVEEIGKVHGFRELTVCEDETEAYSYWQKNVNANPEDCCNLRGEGEGEDFDLSLYMNAPEGGEG